MSCYYSIFLRFQEVRKNVKILVKISMQDFWVANLIFFCNFGFCFGWHYLWTVHVTCYMFVLGSKKHEFQHNVIYRQPLNLYCILFWIFYLAFVRFNMTKSVNDPLHFWAFKIFEFISSDFQFSLSSQVFIFHFFY